MNNQFTLSETFFASLIVIAIFLFIAFLDFLQL